MEGYYETKAGYDFWKKQYNNEISKTIDKYWDIIDFDYDNYYSEM